MLAHSFSTSAFSRLALACTLALALLTTACSSSNSTATPDLVPESDPTVETFTVESLVDEDSAAPGAVSVPLTEPSCTAPTVDDAPALNAAGEAMFRQRMSTGQGYPSYELDVAIDPEDGAVSGRMQATIPDQGEFLHFRVFPGEISFDSDLQIRNVTVNGQPVEPSLEQTLLTLANPDPGAGADSVVEMMFRYVLQETAVSGNVLDGLTGESLEPAKVGLLGRTPGGAQMGHWFPVWLPPVSSADASLDGFGDIGAFPAAAICVTLQTPSEYSVISGGVRVAESTADGITTVTEVGLGLRDMALLLSRNLSLKTAEVDGVKINVWGPVDDEASTQTVLDYSVSSQRSLVDAFGPYPWTEVDLVAAPLGSGVGGMEWPGMIWIEAGLFGGGIPGLGSLGDDPAFAGLEDLLGSGAFDDLLSGLPGGESLETSLVWTVAHELGHEWWHAVVGNDSIESPAVDEPLAQFAACIAMRDLYPENWRDICEAQTLDTYSQTRGLMGIEDAPAEQASDEFDSSVQYGAIVYGKAPGFYFEAGDLLGWDVLEDALKAFVAKYPFELVATDVLRQHLIDSAGDQGTVIGELWDRWFREAHGDEDIGVAEGSPLGGLGGEGGIDLESLLGEGGALEDLFGGQSAEELFGGDSPLADLLGDNAEGIDFDALMKQLLENAGDN